MAGVLALSLAGACGTSPKVEIAVVPHVVLTTTTAVPTTLPPRPKPRPTRGTIRLQAATGDLSALLDRLAMCESHHNPKAVGGGGRFWGAFQFMLSTWRGMGMSGNPIDYSYEEQKAVAARIPVSAWARQFPACARRLGVA